MSVANERLYNLLPAVYRVRDAAQGEPLRALLAVIEHEVRLLEDDLDGLYENWFIETCDEWVVPYIGDLLGVHGLLPVAQGTFSQRGRVANALGYRRRKGTAAMLEQLARDVTGYPAKAVEFFERLAVTQYMNHVRPGCGGTADLHHADRLELVTTPFDPCAHTADIRHIDNGRGTYNLMNIGLYLWRLQSYRLARATPRLLATGDQYAFGALDQDQPLFNVPRTETTITELADELNVPAPLRRRVLHAELTAARTALAAGQTPVWRYFGADPVFEVFYRDAGAAGYTQIAPQNIAICNLAGTARPSAPFEAAVDPVLGQLVFPTGVTHADVQVSYAYGFSGDLGGGPYNRRSSVASWLDPGDGRAVWQIGVTMGAVDDPTDGRFDPQLRHSLAAAVEAWHGQSGGTLGLITIMDNGSYPTNLGGDGTIRIPAGSTLAIVAADWPQVADPERPGAQQRIAKALVPVNLRPHLQGNLAVRGTAAADRVDPGALILDGLLVEGGLTVLVGNLGRVRLLHSTLVPGAGGLTVNPSVVAGQQNEQLTLDLTRSVCGTITAPDTIRAVEIRDAIIDGGAGTALVGPNTRIETSTIIGATRVQTLTASESIFTASVLVTRRQLGCVRYCYLPLGSRAPRRFHCVPSTTATAQAIFPQFTSLHYGDPGYGQLAATCPSAISTGAADEGEQGAFHFGQQAQRQRNLVASLDEYLRFGLEAGIFFVT